MDPPDVRPYPESMKMLESQALEALVALSNHYGSQTEYVIAGGGNTSWKNEGTLWVKSSGQALADIRLEGFVRMNRRALGALWTRPFSADAAQREQQVLESLMAARIPGEEAKRPSVETLLHDLLPFPFVVHTHPTLINALTCGREGKSAFDRLFAGEAVWIPLTDPGYILSKAVKEALEEFEKRNKTVPRIIFLQNHGIVVAGETPEEIRASYDRIGALLSGEAAFAADLTPQNVSEEAEAAFRAVLIETARTAFGSGPLSVVRSTARSALEAASDSLAFEGLSSAFTPDHIVYMGVSPVRVDTADQLADAFAGYQARYGKAPQVVLARGLGAFCLGRSEKAAVQAQLLFLDALKISVASRSFGGPLFMTPASIDFIRNWEVESYRSRVSNQ